MKRMFGLMPKEEVKYSRRFKDKYDGLVMIEAGPHGWDIIYADSSVDWNDAGLRLILRRLIKLRMDR